MNVVSTALEKQESTELIEAQIAAAQAVEDAASDDLVQAPLLKVAQGLTQEVQDGNAEPGEFVNTLTSEGLGDTVEFIICFYSRGRFASDQESGRSFSAFEATIPPRWADLVGEEFVGTPFSEYPEAEEQFRAACNRKEREWGHGPLVSTTHNYTGLVLVENEAGELEPQPVRLSLKRTEMGGVRKIESIRRTKILGKTQWDKIITLSTTKKKFGRNESWLINPSRIRIGRPTTAEEKGLAVLVAQAAASGRIEATGQDEETISEPDAKGGIAV